MDTSILFTEAFNEQMQRYRERFLAGEDVSSNVRPDIYESWTRCRYWNVDPEVVDYSPLTAEEFQMISQEESELKDVAEPIIKRIFDYTKNFECLLSFANAKGIMLNTWLGQYFPNISSGTYVREKNVGTAGIPTSLYTGKSITVYGYEHYCYPHHDIVCSASPIYNTRGILLGAISMSCSIKMYHPYNNIIIQEAAKSISEQLRLRFLLSMDNMLIDSFGEGVLLVDENGNILRANNKAVSLLQRDPVINKDTIDTLFYSEELRKNIVLGKQFYNEEVKIKNTRNNEKGIYFVVSFTPTEHGGVLICRPAKEMHSYAAKVLGNTAQYQFSDILGKSPQIQECITMGKKMADSSYTVLLLGQSGTGKELFAQAIHNASSRRHNPFIAVNCGALPRDLVQSELFGYAEGAFTGASRQGKPGKFELAEGGTLFLDEVGEMSLDAQVSLLRLLQNHEVVRIGGKTVRHIDVRLIAATNRDLRREVELHRFREDLYYRLNVFTLYIPSLKERNSDIPVLANAFLKKISDQHPQFRSFVFSNEAMNILEKREWPGNIRELEHTIERAVFTATTNIIQPEDVSFLEYSKNIDISHNILSSESVKQADNNEKSVIEEVLKQTSGNVLESASLLGISKSTLYTRCLQYNIYPKKYKKLHILN